MKVFEGMLVNHMTTYLEEENNKLNTNHCGLQTSRSCLAQLLAHHEQILTSLEHNTNVVHLHFAKAHDKMDHGIVLHKVQRITGTQLGLWLHSVLTNRRQQAVMIEGVVVTQPHYQLRDAGNNHCA